MKCPYCDFTGSRMALHGHLTDGHPEEVKIYVDEASGHLVFELTCPICKDTTKQALKKSAKVLEQYQREIRMVAYDLLLYHLADSHAENGEPS